MTPKAGYSEKSNLTKKMEAAENGVLDMTPIAEEPIDPTLNFKFFDSEISKHNTRTVTTAPCASINNLAECIASKGLKFDIHDAILAIDIYLRIVTGESGIDNHNINPMKAKYIYTLGLINTESDFFDFSEIEYKASLLFLDVLGYTVNTYNSIMADRIRYIRKNLSIIFPEVSAFVNELIKKLTYDFSKNDCTTIYYYSSSVANAYKEENTISFIMLYESSKEDVGKAVPVLYIDATAVQHCSSNYYDEEEEDE